MPDREGVDARGTGAGTGGLGIADEQDRAQRVEFRGTPKHRPHARQNRRRDSRRGERGGQARADWAVRSGRVGAVSVETAIAATASKDVVEIQSKVAVVTGAGSGIGRALATALASAGTHVVVGDIDGGAAEQTVGVISERGHRAVALAGDASTDADIAALIELAAAEFGPVDIYVANAGIGGPPGLVIPEREWDRALDVNLRAHIRAARQLVPAWVDRGGGYFVSVASAAGLLTQLGAAAYAVTKHAAVGFAEWLAITYGDVGIGVSCLCPMGVDTPLLTELRESPE